MPLSVAMNVKASLTTSLDLKLELRRHSQAFEMIGKWQGWQDGFAAPSEQRISAVRRLASGDSPALACYSL